MRVIKYFEPLLQMDPKRTITDPNSRGGNGEETTVWDMEKTDKYKQTKK